MKSVDMKTGSSGETAGDVVGAGGATSPERMGSIRYLLLLLVSTVVLLSAALAAAVFVGDVAARNASAAVGIFRDGLISALQVAVTVAGYVLKHMVNYFASNALTTAGIFHDGLGSTAALFGRFICLVRPVFEVCVVGKTNAVCA